MSRDYKNAADGAKALKLELQKEFPNIKFSVRSKVFAGGDDISVNYELGPTEEQVNAFANKYQEGWFDGMVDLYNYYEDDSFTRINGGAKYVMVTRNIPDDIYYSLLKQYCEIMAGGCYDEKEPWNSRIFNRDGSLQSYATHDMHRILVDVDFRKVKDFKLIFDKEDCEFKVI